MKIKNIKYIIILLIFGVVLFLICYFLDFSKVKNVGYVILDEKNVFEYNNDKWYKSTSNDADWNLFHVYSEYDYVNDYYLVKNGLYYFFDKNKKSYKVNYPFIAIDEKLDMELIDYFEDSVNDDDLNNINSYLKKKKISYNGEFSNIKKYIVNLNNDNNDDYIYVISNQLYSDNPIFATFAKVGSKYIDISFSFDSAKIFDLAYIVSFNHNGFNDIVIKKYNGEKVKYYFGIYNDNNYSFVG